MYNDGVFESLKRSTLYTISGVDGEWIYIDKGGDTLISGVLDDEIGFAKSLVLVQQFVDALNKALQEEREQTL